MYALASLHCCIMWIRSRVFSASKSVEWYSEAVIFLLRTAIFLLASLCLKGESMREIKDGLFCSFCLVVHAPGATEKMVAHHITNMCFMSGFIPGLLRGSFRFKDNANKFCAFFSVFFRPHFGPPEPHFF